MATFETIKPIKVRAEADLLARDGVTGVDIGYKVVGGEKTDVPAIRVYVEHKRNVTGKQRIPASIEGVPTDVIERTFELHGRFVKVADIELQADTGTYDPLQGGISIGPCRSIYLDAAAAACHKAPGPGYYTFVGTLGAFVRDNVTSAEMMLSNFHVMCVDDAWSVGDTMAQPSRPDGGSCPAQVVGALQRAALGGQVDSAVASHTARGFDCSIVDIGDVAGTAVATVGMAVRKRGRTTGLTYGTVDTVSLTVTLNYCDGLGSVTLTDQIGIDVDPAQSAKFGAGGDSGSVVVDGQRNVVGLYFAGSTDGLYGIANPIDEVLTALNVSMCAKPAKKFEPDTIIKKFEPDTIIKKFEPDTIIKKFEPDKKYEPDIKKREPDIKKNEPDIKKREPDDIKKFEPDIKKHEPDDKKFEPDIKKHEPDVKKFEPDDIKKFEPDIKKHEPDIKKPEPDDIKKFEPEGPGDPGVVYPVEARMARIEAALAQLQHFIRQDLRPDVERAPLRNEDPGSSS